MIPELTATTSLHNATWIQTENKTNMSIRRYVHLLHTKRRKTSYMFRTPWLTVFMEVFCEQYILQRHQNQGKNIKYFVFVHRF